MKAYTVLLIATTIAIASCQNLTKPDLLINHKASLPSSFKLSDLHEKVITAFINKRDSTMSVLYGNKAGEYLLQSNDSSNRQDVALTLVTWRQQDDPHWFGARIPGNLLSVESVTTDKKGNDSYHYSKFTGKSLTIMRDTAGQSARIAFILAHKPLL